MKLKFTVLSLFFFLTATAAFSQSNSKIPFLRSILGNKNVYKTIDELEVQKVYDLKKGKVVNDPTKYKIKPADGDFLRFKVINEDESIISIPPMTKFVSSGGNHTIEYRGENDTKPADDPADYYFKIVDELTTPAKKFLATEHLTAIPLTIPLKYRSSAYDGETQFNFDANINYGFGYKVRMNNNPYKDRFIRPLIAIGFGLQDYMPIDSVKSETFEANNEFVFSYSVGVAYEAGSSFNIGVFLGWDRMFGSKKDWYYQNRAWWGIGIGYKFD